MPTFLLALSLLAGCEEVSVRERVIGRLVDDLLPRKVWTREVLTEAKRQGKVSWVGGMLRVENPGALQSQVCEQYGLQRGILRRFLCEWSTPELVWLTTKGRAGAAPDADRAADVGWHLRTGQLSIRKALAAR